MKTMKKKKEMALRLRESRREEQKPETTNLSPDDDAESDLPIRGRPSKKLLIQQQQQRQYQEKLEPKVKTVTVGASEKPSTSSSAAAAAAAAAGGRMKARRVLYKKSVGSAAVAQKAPGETYVMRLFERSLDLSKYRDKTPLYPICRAWMANQPKNPAVGAFQTDDSFTATKREDNGEEILSQIKSGEIKMINQLPQAKATDLPIIPPRLEFSQEDKKREKALQGASTYDLMFSNMNRWKKVRGHWIKHIKKYEKERYEVIDKIMSLVCKN
ncbi:protein lin-37 homolog [Drosophila sechellia]|uniref:GM19840 n=1 Tax=Drosophila sechellia TaxID=7238 RepID=B4HPE0_DROSE|nr:protein lin-37 homolog [Drosophila sechellia]EDW48578.1 GM19840 [Drosophila sechellia]